MSTTSYMAMRAIAAAAICIAFTCVARDVALPAAHAFSHPTISASSQSTSHLKLSASSSHDDNRMVTIGSDKSRPNGCTYWATPNFLAGEYPTVSYGSEQETRRKLGAYLDHGIRTFVDLTQEGEKEDYTEVLQEEAAKRNIQNVQYHRISIPDFGIPASKQTMTKVLDTIDDGLSNGVYVHCRGGIGRTGTTVGCWLVRNAGLTGDAALNETNRLFKSSERSRESAYSPETRDQMDFVRTWNEN